MNCELFPLNIHYLHHSYKEAVSWSQGCLAKRAVLFFGWYWIVSRLLHSSCLGSVGLHCATFESRQPPSGFSWCGILSTWHSAVFWIQYGNNVDNAVVFWLLLSSAHSKSRTFQLPILCQWVGAQKAGTEYDWESWLKLAKEIFHTIEHHDQYINRGSWLWGKDSKYHWKMHVVRILKIFFPMHQWQGHHISIFWASQWCTHSQYS